MGSGKKQGFVARQTSTLTTETIHEPTRETTGESTSKDPSKDPSKEESIKQEKKESIKQEKAIEQDLRWQRIVMNDLENIPFGLMMGILSVYNQGNPIVSCIALISFTISRIGHTYSYAHEIQPHRALFWFAAILSSITLGLNGLIGAFIAYSRS